MFIRAGNAYTWAAFLVVHDIFSLELLLQKDTKKNKTKKTRIRKTAEDKYNELSQNRSSPAGTFKSHRETALSCVLLPPGAAGAEPSALALPLSPAGPLGATVSSLTRHGDRRLLPQRARPPAARRPGEGARREPGDRPRQLEPQAERPFSGPRAPAEETRPPPPPARRSRESPGHTGRPAVGKVQGTVLHGSCASFKLFRVCSCAAAPGSVGEANPTGSPELQPLHTRA